WVCVAADYRLSPSATFPDHLIDLKRAVAWIREHGALYGADPDFLIVTGGSAGAHLAALVALTPNAPEYQPGFEGVDTAVDGCVAFYGVYDFTDRHGLWPDNGLRRLLERRVLKVPFASAPGVYEKASPLSRLRPDAPPFLVLHGTHDTLVPIEEARRFCDAFRRVVRAPLVYAELPGAQPAFEIFPSVRTTFVLPGVERFLAWVYAGYPRPRATVPPAPGPEYTCPMHPEVVRSEPGTCPLCGMALERAEEEASPELADMSRRFWLSLILTLPLFLAVMADMLPGEPLRHAFAGGALAWIELALATPVVLWGGWRSEERRG